MSFCSAKKISDDSTTDRMPERRVKWIQMSSAMISQVASKQRAAKDFLLGLTPKHKFQIAR
jgi:hypothetical protein